MPSHGWVWAALLLGLVSCTYPFPPLPGADQGAVPDGGSGAPDLPPRAAWRQLGPTPADSDLTAIAGTADTDYYVTTHDAILHRQGGQTTVEWRAPKAGTACLRSLWVGKGEVIAAGGCGADGLLVRRAVAGYVTRALGNTRVGGVWVESADSIYVASPSDGIFRVVGPDMTPDALQWSVSLSEPGTGPVAFYGAALDGLYAVGDRRILQRVSGRWESQADQPVGTRLLSITGAGTGAAAEVFIVGSINNTGAPQGLALHRRGAAPFTREVVSGPTALLSVWANSAADVWAVADGGGVLRRAALAVPRWDEERPRAADQSSLRGLWGLPPQTLLAAGAGGALRRDPVGPTWRGEYGSQITGAALSGVSVTPSGMAWFVGAAGTIYQLSSAAGTPVREAAGLLAQDLTAVAGLDGGVAYAVGQRGVVLRREAGAWTVEQGAAVGAADLYGVAADGAGAAYAVGDGGTLLSRSLGAWSPVGVFLNDGTKVTAALRAAVIPPGGGLIVAGAEGLLLRRGPGEVRFAQVVPYVPGASTVYVGAALLGGEVWVAAQSGAVVRLSGAQVTRLQALEYRVTGIGGTGPADVYLSGADGRLLHYDGYGFRDEPAPILEPLAAVSASAAYALSVGAEGVVLQRP